MAIHQKFAAKVDGYGLKFTQPDAWANTLQSYKGKTVRVVIKPVGEDNIRSLDANAYYWGVVVEIIRNDLGYEREEMHDALGFMFRMDYKGPMPTVKRTSTMSSQEFWDYIERIRRWYATEYQGFIPDPNKVSI